MDVRSGNGAVTALDPMAAAGLDERRARAILRAKQEGARRRPGPGAEDAAVAQLYLGMREADHELALRIEEMLAPDGRGIPPTGTTALVAHAFERAVTAHRAALDRAAPPDRARWFGARNASAVSYAELALRDADHPDAPDVADRLVGALESGIEEPQLLLDAAWDSPFPIVLQP